MLGAQYECSSPRCTCKRVRFETSLDRLVKSKADAECAATEQRRGLGLGGGGGDGEDGGGCNWSEARQYSGVEYAARECGGQRYGERRSRGAARRAKRVKRGDENARSDQRAACERK
jgi:hypothetical protein